MVFRHIWFFVSSGALLIWVEGWFIRKAEVRSWFAGTANAKTDLLLSSGLLRVVS